MPNFSQVKNHFKSCLTPKDRYQKIIDLGKTLLPFPSEKKIEVHRVKGCQSIVYLYTELREGHLFFTGYSDALISSGLAALLIEAYNDQRPEYILKCKPTFIEELSLASSLSATRSNGLANIYLKMQQDAIKFLIPL